MVSTDEACTNYQDIITNMVEGRRWLAETFRVQPKIGWQLDPFGHSSANARLFAEMGLEAIVFARLDKPTQDELDAQKARQFLWQPEFG
jgi:alpha-mannosidase